MPPRVAPRLARASTRSLPCHALASTVTLKAPPRSRILSSLAMDSKYKELEQPNAAMGKAIYKENL